MDLAPLIQGNNVGPLNLSRTPEPTQNQFGDFTAGSPVVTALDPVSVHTLAGRDLEQLPEADRHKEMIQLYTTERLFVGEDGNTSDRVAYQGRTWRVTRVDDYDQQGAVFFALATLEDA